MVKVLGSLGGSLVIIGTIILVATSIFPGNQPVSPFIVQPIDPNSTAKSDVSNTEIEAGPFRLATDFIGMINEVRLASAFILLIFGTVLLSMEYGKSRIFWKKGE